MPKPLFVTPHQWAKDRTPAQWANHHVRVVGVLIILLLLCAYPAALFVMSVIGVRHEAKAAAVQRQADDRPTGSGVVLSMNDTTMTVQHGQVSGAPIGPGTTAFLTAPRILERTRVGDQVTFFLVPQPGGAYAIGALRNQDLEEMGKNPLLTPGRTGDQGGGKAN
jgi:hypothetical protein